MAVKFILLIDLIINQTKTQGTTTFADIVDDQSDSSSEDDEDEESEDGGIEEVEEEGEAN